MQMKQSSLDFYAFVETYRDRIVGCFIKKIYQVSAKEFYFQLYRQDLKRVGLYISLERGIAFYDPLLPSQSSGLATLLRKMLSEKRITGIEQINFDRVVRISLGTGNSIILELFREGNLIVTEGNAIQWALVQREWRNRKIVKGEPYSPPSPTDPLNMNPEAVAKVLSESRASLVQTLATRMNLGGEVSEELIFRSGLRKESPSREMADSSPSIVELFHSILAEALEKKAYFYSAQTIVSPVRLTHLATDPDRIFESLNEGYAYYFQQFPYSQPQETSLERRIRSQQKSIQEFEKLSEELARKGSLVMSQIDKFSKLLSSVGPAGTEVKSGSGSEFTDLKVDRGHRTVSVRYLETDLELSYEMSAGANAESLFNQSKSYRDKASGAREALSRSMLESTITQARPEVKRSKQWFESFRWFFTSEGFLVISGRDRKTNETVVKKHMAPGDLYIHADLYGAPSTVLKADPPRKPGEASIREACVFSLSMSRAWSAGIASGSAYWVFPEQVSKTPESGEYVSTGSWIVRGRRNYLFNLPLELEIGFAKIRDGSIPMISPSGVIAVDSISVTLRPGTEKRNSVVATIAKLLDVKKDELDALLPPGNSSIVRMNRTKQENASVQ